MCHFCMHTKRGGRSRQDPGKSAPLRLAGFYRRLTRAARQNLHVRRMNKRASERTAKIPRLVPIIAALAALIAPESVNPNLPFYDDTTLVSSGSAAVRSKSPLSRLYVSRREFSSSFSFFARNLKNINLFRDTTRTRVFGHVRFFSLTL